MPRYEIMKFCKYMIKEYSKFPKDYYNGLYKLEYFKWIMDVTHKYKNIPELEAAL